ncbi:MAG: hypothetical protein JWO37_3320 [Acidimicrobiales bacterium]|nr:hypothetical protein [Acidimicrobiales bacterium]
MVTAPDERALRAHLRGGRFVAGVAGWEWQLLSISWPFAVIAISAAERDNGPKEFAVRFELTGYPHTAPTGGLWDVDADACLPPDRRPKGERVGMLFRTDGWAGGASAMYAPWDRIGLQAHPDWAEKYPMEAWNPTRDLSFILSQLHERFNADDYLGV